jgi:hypothetical protein
MRFRGLAVILACGFGTAAGAGANPAQPVTTTPMTTTLNVPSGGGRGQPVYFTININPSGNLTFALTPGGGGNFSSGGRVPVINIAPVGTN